MKNVLTIFLFAIALISAAQDLEQFDKKNPIKFNGNISVGSSFYNSIGRESNRVPFGYFISANPTLTLFGFDIPVSLVYRNSQTTVSNPFNRFTIAPKYKWVSLRFGNAAMNFHQYVLSGQVIKGIGVELTPGNWYLGGVKGKLQNPLAQIDTLNSGPMILPFYEREAEAIKLGYNANRFKILLSAFRAKDDVNSLILSSAERTGLNPEANVVFGADIKISPFKWFTIFAQPAASAHTANQNTSSWFENAELTKINDQYGDIIPINFSTRLQFAGDAGVKFNFGKVGFGLKYQRVDPLYKSLGTFYFNEDYENVLGTFNATLFKSKVRINSQVGVQRNNLNNLRSVTNERTIANVNISIIANKTISTSLRYSNFQTDRSPGLTAVNDTLRITRTSESYGIAPRFLFGSKDRSSAISLSASYQLLDDLLNDVNSGNAIQNYVVNANYNFSGKKTGLKWGLGLIGNQNLIQENETQRIGGRANFSKSLNQKKLTLGIASTYTINFLNDQNNGASLANNVSLRYKPSKSISASARINHLSRLGIMEPYQEIRATINLTFSLATKKKKDEK